MNLNIGKKIEEVWKNSGMTKTAFANKIGMNRNNVYYLFERANIDADLLKVVGSVLNFNFFELYEPTDLVKEPQTVYQKTIKESPAKTAKISIMIEFDPDINILMDEVFNQKLKDLMGYVSK